MSSQLGYSSFQSDGAYEQPRSSLVPQTQQHPARGTNPFFQQPFNQPLGSPVAPNNNPYYPQQHTEQTMTRNNPIQPPIINYRLGSQYNPIVLGSDDSAYQGHKPPAPPNYTWAYTPSNTIDLTNPSQNYGTVNNSPNNPFQGGNGYLTDNVVDLTAAEYAPWQGNNYKINQPPNPQGYPSTAYQPQGNFQPPTTFPNNNWAAQPQPSPASQPYQSNFAQPNNSFYSPTNTVPSYNSVFPVGRNNEPRSPQNVAGVAYGPGRYNTVAVRPGGVENSVPRKVPLVKPEDLKRVEDFFASCLNKRATDPQLCPNFVSGFSGIISAVRAEDRRKASTVPYNQDAKVSSFRCVECKMTVCLGCASKIGSAKVPSAVLFHNCVHSHLVSIALILARIDTRWQLREFGTPTPSAQRKPSVPDHLVPAQPLSIPDFSAASTHGSGVGYGSGSTNGRGGIANKRGAKTATKMRQESDDNKALADLLWSLAKLLTDDIDEYSMICLLGEKEQLLVSLFKVSYLPELIRSLVRNDSIMDIDAGDAWELYTACLNLLRVLADHEPLLGLLVSALDEKKQSPGLAHIIKLPDAPILRGLLSAKQRANVSGNEPVDFILAEGVEGVAQPIIQSFEKLVKQCQAFMSNASRMTTMDDDEETNRLLSFCIDVDSTAIKLNRRADDWKRKRDQSRPPPMGQKNSHLESLPPHILSHPLLANNIYSPQQARVYNPLEVSPQIKQQCKDALTSHLQYKFSPDVISTHCNGIQNNTYNAIPAVAANSAPNPGRMKRLIKELTVLSTTLPPGIFVRVQEDVPDTFKAMIVGPDSSPYHLGLYEFDFTIPANYPNSPPTVTFKTTGGGAVRFNPNLYECGKVCLSILNTWSGSASEQWQPKTSTLLQVLVSIQGMILCAEPYYNEPGYQNSPNPSASRSYNENVQINSIRHAMNGWLSYNGLWNDVIHAHFLANSEEILSTTQKFVNAGDSPTPASGAANPPGNIYNGTASNGLFGNAFAGFQPAPPGIHVAGAEASSTKTTMQKARADLETAMKTALPNFSKAELWRERAEG